MPSTKFTCKCGALWSVLKTCPLCSCTVGWEAREAREKARAAQLEADIQEERTHRLRLQRLDTSLTIAQRIGWEHYVR